MMVAARKASLVIDLNPVFVPLVLDFAEGSARAFGFGDSDIIKVRLASEEIFEYLCRAGRSGQEFRIEAASSVYEMELKFVFAARDFDPYAFNLTASISADENNIENLGLLIASRSVDRFSIRYSQAEGIVLVLVKEKTYSLQADDSMEPEKPLKSFSVKTPEQEILKRFVARACRHYETLSFPERFRSPHKVVDMVQGGDCRVLVATGTGTEGAEVAGGLIWRAAGKNMIQFYGPYIFDQPLKADISLSLTEHFLAAVGRTDAVGLISQHTTPDLPEGHFEPLGSVEYHLPNGSPESRFFYYRQLREDAGSYVWADDGLAAFLRSAYERLVLPRQVLDVANDEQYAGPHSVFSVEFDRPLNSVTVRPAWDGMDRAQNVADHLAVLVKEGLANIFFEIDVGVAWQAKLASILFIHGFAPALLVPYGGEHGDLVIFQYTGQAA